MSSLTNIYPDLCAVVMVLSRISADKFNLKHFKLTNNSMKRAIDINNRRIWQYQLNQNLERMISFSDSSFSNCDDMVTKLGFIVLQMDNTRRANWLTYSSYKFNSVLRPVLAWEIYAFADCFGAA